MMPMPSYRLYRQVIRQGTASNERLNMKHIKQDTRFLNTLIKKEKNYA